MMQTYKLKIMSLNVNGLGNPIKRARVMKKITKDNMHIIMLQETHLGPEEHEKLTKFGYNIFYSSYSQNHRRGVAILISKKIKCDNLKEIKDKEGRFSIVKGKVENNLITFVNIYAPPESELSFYKAFLDTVIAEAEGICVCGGDWKVVLNLKWDTTSNNRREKKSQI